MARLGDEADIYATSRLISNTWRGGAGSPAWHRATRFSGCSPGSPPGLGAGACLVRHLACPCNCKSLALYRLGCIALCKPGNADGRHKAAGSGLRSCLYKNDGSREPAVACVYRPRNPLPETHINVDNLTGLESFGTGHDEVQVL